MISLLLAIAIIASNGAGAKRAAAQTSPGCQPGYYYASDGYCYPNQQPTYAYPPPVYESTPPVYQPPAVFDGLAIGVGLGLLFGALANNGDHGGGDRNRARDNRGGRGRH